MPTSQIDDAVYKYLQSRTHSFVTLSIEGMSAEYCEHCGLRRDALKKDPNSYELRPCRGFIGGL